MKRHCNTTSKTREPEPNKNMRSSNSDLQILQYVYANLTVKSRAYVSFVLKSGDSAISLVRSITMAQDNYATNSDDKCGTSLSFCGNGFLWLFVTVADEQVAATSTQSLFAYFRSVRLGLPTHHSSPHRVCGRHLETGYKGKITPNGTYQQYCFNWKSKLLATPHFSSFRSIVRCSWYP